MRSLILTILAASVSTAYAQSPPAGPPPASRADAVQAINDATNFLNDWADFMSDLDDEIMALPAGPQRDAIEDAYDIFFVSWLAADTAAEDAIDDANDHLADGDAETNQTLAEEHYGLAVEDAGASQAHLSALVATSYAQFIIVCLANNWLPSVTAPGS